MSDSMRPGSESGRGMQRPVRFTPIRDCLWLATIEQAVSQSSWVLRECLAGQVSHLGVCDFESVEATLKPNQMRRPKNQEDPALNDCGRHSFCPVCWHRLGVRAPKFCPLANFCSPLCVLVVHLMIRISPLASGLGSTGAFLPYAICS